MSVAVIVLMAVLVGMTVSMKGVMVMRMVVSMRMPMDMIVRMTVERFLAPNPPHQHPYAYCNNYKTSY